MKYIVLNTVLLLNPAIRFRDIFGYLQILFTQTKKVWRVMSIILRAIADYALVADAQPEKKVLWNKRN